MQARCEAAEDQNKELRLKNNELGEEMAQLKMFIKEASACCV